MSLTLPPLTKPQFKFKSRRHFIPIVCSSNSRSNPSPFSLVSFLRWIPDWADEVKESRVKNPRPLYKPENWRDHRSSQRHLRHLLTSLSSRVILSLIPPVFSLTTFAAFIALYNTAVSLEWLPNSIFPVLKASPLPYQLTAPALALLLVFRTEASYARFVEGRKVWMKVIVGAGELASIVLNLNGKDGLIRRSLINYIMAFPVVLKCHIIDGSDIRADLRNLLEEEDLSILLRSNHRPRCIIEFITQSVHVLHLDEQKRNLLEEKISCFHEGIGVCEQLIQLPIPLSYTRLTSRFLVLWHLSLPIILWEDCNWIVVPATFISAASLFCIEEVGVLIEEPFPNLSLDESCKKLHDSIEDIMSIHNMVHRRIHAKMKDIDKREVIDGRVNIF
ncbi:voltage-dependent chloride channel 1, chloroplastic-like [Carex rostrata]